MNKARITYRFDQDTRQLNEWDLQSSAKKPQETQEGGLKLVNNEAATVKPEEPQIYDTQQINQFTTDYGAWSSPFDIETQRLEELIRRTDAEQDLPPKQEQNKTINDGFSQEPEHFGPLVVEDEKIWGTASGMSDYSDRTFRNHRSSWFRLITSVTGAIATGVFFGILIIQMFSVDSAPQPKSSSDMPETNQGQVTAPPANEASGTFMPGILGVNIPAMSGYVLQYGVFSTADRASAAQDELAQAGIASAYEIADQHVVYAGFSMNKDSALLLQHQLEKQDLETYVKEYHMPAVTGMKWGGDDGEALTHYWNVSDDLSSDVTRLTLLHLEEVSPTGLDSSTVQSLTDTHKEWTNAVNTVAGNAPAEAQLQFDNMNNALNTALSSMMEYGKNPSVAFLWQAQAAVMDYVVSRKSLVSLLAQ